MYIHLIDEANTDYICQYCENYDNKTCTKYLYIPTNKVYECEDYQFAENQIEYFIRNNIFTDYRQKLNFKIGDIVYCNDKKITKALILDIKEDYIVHPNKTKGKDILNVFQIVTYKINNITKTCNSLNRNIHLTISNQINTLFSEDILIGEIITDLLSYYNEK